MRLPHEPPQEAEISDPSGERVPLGTQSRLIGHPDHRSPQLVGHSVETRSPLADLDVTGPGERVGNPQAPGQVPGARLERLPRHVELLRAVLADDLQRPVAGARRVGDRHEQALVRQLGEDGADPGGDRRRPAVEQFTRHRGGERRREHRDAAQHGLFPVVEQCVTPVQRGTQRTVPVVSARTAGQQVQPVCQAVLEPIEPERGVAGRRKLDRERNAVQRLAYRGDPAQIALHGFRPAGGGSTDEQLDRVRGLSVRPFDGQPRQGEDPFERNQKPGTRGGEHREVRRIRQEPFEEDDHAIQEVLAVVEDEQDLALSEPTRERVLR